MSARLSGCALAVAVVTATGVIATTLSGCDAASAPHRSIAPRPTGSTTATTHPGVIAPLENGPTGPAHPDSSTAVVVAAPVELRIPAIGVRSGLQHLHLASDGTLQTPSRWQVAGWYADGTRPGDVGPAIIAGHVDSTHGPAVFFRLRRLRPGDVVYVDRSDGTTVSFAVARTTEYPKRKFPTEAVYGPVAVPTLRLVTCTGDFDVSKHSYVDNLVVTAYAT